MQRTRVSYSLKQFTASTVPGFSDALKLYARAFPPSLKTNTNEITYWLDHYSQFPDDRFLVFGFYANQKLVGYAQLAYFSSECLLVVDYLVVDEKHRRDNVFFEFLEHLRVAVDAAGLQVDYVVAEIALDGAEDSASIKAPYLIRLLRFIGFGIARAAYFQPQLGAENYESKVRAALAISTTGDAPLKHLRKETYLRIVETIFYKHYLRWYEIYSNQHPEYRKHLDSVFRVIRESLAKQEYVIVNGQPKPLATESVVQTEDARVLRFTVLSLSIVVVLTVLLFATTTGFGVSIAVVLPVYLLALISVFAVFSMKSKDAKSVLSDLIRLLLSWSRTK